MEHKTLDMLRDVAVVLPGRSSARPLSKSERLLLWAAALEREGGRQLSTLYQVEYAPQAERTAMRADDSLLSVAFKDPRLRAEGLAGDTVGDALAFFRISERQLHDIACFCHHGPSVSAKIAAAQVRAISTSRPAEMRAFAIGAIVTVSMAAALLML